MAAHSLHVHWAGQVKSCEKTLKASWKSLHNLQTSWRDHHHKKKSPLSHSVLNRCHINNFLHWDVQTADKLFPTVQHETPRRKHSVHSPRFMWPWNLLAKRMSHGTHLGESDSRFVQFKLCYTQLQAQLLRIFKIFIYLFLAASGHSCNTFIAAHRFSCSKACGTLVPQPMSPALEGRFLTTGPPGKSLNSENLTGAVALQQADQGIMTYLSCSHRSNHS